MLVRFFNQKDDYIGCGSFNPVDGLWEAFIFTKIADSTIKKINDLLLHGETAGTVNQIGFELISAKKSKKVKNSPAWDEDWV